MKVLKFGGTSVADANAWRQVVSIIKTSTPCVVVVSATAKTTNDLLDAANLAKSGDLDQSYQLVEKVRQRHQAIIDELIPADSYVDQFENATVWVEQHLNRLKNYLLGISTLGELTPRSLDTISCIGEQISAHLISIYAIIDGVSAISVDSREVIITNDEFGKAIPLLKEIKSRSELLQAQINSGKTPIMGGFYGSNLKGETTTLGRGGSDYTASLVGLALESDMIEIWTDVSGMYTSDPRYVKGAFPIAEITFDEAAELAYFGAKVLHPATIQPAVEKNIPVFIRNTFEPEQIGTKIFAGANLSGPVRAIAFKRGIIVVTVTSSRMLLAYGFLSKVFSIFEKHQVSVDLVSTSEVSISMSVDSKERLDLVLEELRNFGKVTVRNNMTLVCVVGQKFLKASGIAGRIFKVVEHVPIQLISQGSSDINLSFVVNDNDSDEVVQLLHREFFST